MGSRRRDPTGYLLWQLGFSGNAHNLYRIRNLTEFKRLLAAKNKHKTKAACIAVLGTGSEVGKSVITTALCRIFSNRGIRVAPFKAQNMSNNSGVTPDGFEMGRAQIVQAEAAGIPPHVDMNPVLLKPTAKIGSQVVLLGSVIESGQTGAAGKDNERLFKEACGALDRLSAEYELIILEGAGSCAEVNLMSRDIVNFRMAAYADGPGSAVASSISSGAISISLKKASAGSRKKPQSRFSASCPGITTSGLNPKIQLSLKAPKKSPLKTAKTQRLPLSACRIFQTLRILIRCWR